MHRGFAHLLAGSLIAGAAWGQKRLLYLLILTWVVPYSIYLLYFVAVKPDHYWLPVLIPLFSCAFAIFDLIPASWGNGAQRFSIRPFPWGKIVLFLAAILLAWQFVTNISRPISGNVAIYTSAIDRGILQIQAAGAKN